jgi:hypothetical protein
VPDRLSAARQGGERLLDALVAMALLVKVNHTYFNTPSGKELLSKDPPKYLGHIIMHQRNPTSWRGARK